jgi:hypothetical protein
MFETEQRKQLRLAVIDLFTRYKKNRDNFQKTLDRQDCLSDKELEKLANSVKSLEKNTYLLAVVGESKSGKSTFINGLIRKPLLPTGILQCTCNIIEIVDTHDEHDERGKFYLAVKYADNREETQVSKNGDITDIKAKLHTLSALPDKYRNLPVVQLNDHLIEQKPAQITDRDIETLWSKSLDNPKKLSEDKFKHSMMEYLKEYRDLSKIATQITIGCPLDFKFTRLRIVDTPGVNATGGLEQKTIEYIREANAAIFIHQPKNIASKSLEEFFRTVEKVIVKNIFMIITHKAQYAEAEIEAVIEDARSAFPEINPDRVVAVDSMLKIIHDQLKTGIPLKELLKDDGIRKLIAIYNLSHGDDVGRIQKALLEDSNFPSVQKLLRDFSAKAMDQLLIDVVEKITLGYEEQRNVYEQEVSLKNSKATKKPEEFNHEINTLKRLLADYRRILGDFSKSKNSEYTGLHSEVRKNVDILKEVCRDLVKRSRDEQEIFKHVSDFNTDCEKFLVSCTTRLSKEYETEMARVGLEFNRQHLITPPRISFDGISDQAKERSYEVTKIPGTQRTNALGGALAGAISGGLIGLSGGPLGIVIGAVVGAAAAGSGGYIKGKPAENIREFNNEKYVDILKQELPPFLDDVSSAMSSLITNLFKEYDVVFQERLGSLIEDRQRACETLRTSQVNAEALYKEIELCSSRLQVVENELQTINNLKKRLSQIMEEISI